MTTRILKSLANGVSKVALLSLLLTFVGLPSPPSALAEVPRARGEELVRKVQEVLPNGWKATYDREYAWLTVARSEKIQVYSVVPNAEPRQKPKLHEFAFTFAMAPAISKADYDRLAAENAKTQKESAAIYEDLIKRKVSHKFDSFHSDKEDEKKLIERYDDLQKSRHSLPDYQFEGIGLTWGFNSPHNPIFQASDEAIQEECTRVRESVLKVFSPYAAPGAPAIEPKK